MKLSFVLMNFLAHAYLSFGKPQIVTGNMISDFVKGSSKFLFSKEIQKGITLHRNIDEFTDAHPVTKKAKQIFRPSYRLYSGAIMDVLYDHFLASDESIFNETSLKKFTSEIYTTIENNTEALPAKFVHVFSYMKMDDWLFNYRYKEGIEKGLKGLIRRSAFLSESETAYNLFLEHYIFLNESYSEFFKDVQQMAKQRLKELLLEV